MNCPLCNGNVDWTPEVGYYVCERCAECLAPDELVRRATRRTARRYCERNGIPLV